MSNHRILVVDDEDSITTMLKNFLTLEGYDVETCNNPQKAWELFQQKSFPIVISDISMPGLSGVDLLRKIKAHQSFTQVIMMTGFVTLENVLDAFRLGAQNIFFKPFENLDCIKEEIEICTRKIDRIKDVLRTMTQNKDSSKIQQL